MVYASCNPVTQKKEVGVFQAILPVLITSKLQVTTPHKTIVIRPKNLPSTKHRKPLYVRQYKQQSIRH